MASDRIQRRIERLFDQIEQEADQQNWQLVRDLSDEVLRLDPDNGGALAFLSAAERNRDVIRSYQEVCAGAVACFEGYIAQIPREGEGLLIYFGHPQAHEDDPQRGADYDELVEKLT